MIPTDNVITAFPVSISPLLRGYHARLHLFI